MIDLDREILALLEEDAGHAPPVPEARMAIRRTRRRQIGVVLTTLAVVAAVVLGSFAGVSALMRSAERKVPARPNEIPPAVVSGSGLEGYVETTFPLVGWDWVGDVAVAPDGTVWATGRQEGGESFVARFDGQTWTTYTADDGLPGGVWTVDVAPDGTVWAGTEGGLARLDGEAWNVVSPRVSGEHMAFAPDGSVVAVLYTPHGQGPDPPYRADIGWFDGQTWSTMSAGTLPEELRDVIGCLDVSPVDGSIWACAGGGNWVPFKGIWRFDGSGWSSWLEEEWPRGAAHALTIRSDGSVWVLAHDGEGGVSLAGFDGGTWTVFPAPFRTPRIQVRPGVFVFGTEIGPMVTGPDGRVWFVAEESAPARYYPDSLFSFDGSSWTKDRLGSHNVTGLAIAADGTLWVATYDPSTLVRFTPRS
jgi:streptogramin lyase